MTGPDLTPDHLFAHIKTQHGGFHRYGFTDHAYLYNLYFPPQALLACLSDQVPDLVQNYPVAQKDLARLVQEATGLGADRLVVGNGAAELIKILCQGRAGKLIVPVPSFNEYINAGPDTVGFPLDPPGFDLDPERFVRAAVKTGARTAVVVSPNNPTSRAVPARDLKWMAQAFAGRGIRFVVDESFIDFCPDADSRTMVPFLDRFEGLAVIKSMSKAYGICGLRIGYAATCDPGLLKLMQQGVHIWNINGFAEAFLRLLPRYQAAFAQSCQQVMADRDGLYRALCRIKGLEVFAPHANFVFCKLPGSARPAPDVVKSLFLLHKILVKDCAGKDMPEGDRYLRIASRTPGENQALASALAHLLDQTPAPRSDGACLSQSRLPARIKEAQ